MTAIGDSISTILGTPWLYPTLLAALSTSALGVVTTFFAAQEQKAERRRRRELDLALSARDETIAREVAASAIERTLPEGRQRDEALDRIPTKIEIVRENLTEEKPGQNLVEGLVTGYHQQALSQARVQFWFSVVAATIGFLYILLEASKAVQLADLFKILPGAIVDAVAALFFRQAEQTRQRATELYDRLRTDRQMARAELVVNSIEDVTVRSAVRAQIALHMVGLVPKEIDVHAFLPNAQASAVKRSRASDN